MHPEKITVWCGLRAGGVIGPYFFRDDIDRHVTLNGNENRIFLHPIGWYGLGGHVVPIGRRHKPVWLCGECHNQFIGKVWRPCYLTKWFSRLSASVVRFDALRLFPVGLRQVYANKPATIDEPRTNIEYWKSSKIGFSVWTSASVPVVAMQKISSFIHNGIERTFTGITNFID